MKKHTKLLLSLILGFGLGVALHPYADVAWLNALNSNVLVPLSQIFLRLIFMVVVPMIFSAIVLGVFELGSHHGLGRTATKTLLYTIVTSSLSVVIGIGLVNLFKPGVGLNLDPAVLSQSSNSVATIQKNAEATKPFSQIIVDLIPKNPLDAAVRAFDGEMIAFMVFALIFGIALAKIVTERERENLLVKLLEQVFQTCLKIVDFAMVLAPIAVFALVFNTAFKFGHGIFVSLLSYIGVVVFGLAVQQFIVYGSLLKLFTKQAPFEFFKKCREVYLCAFSTASSNATLPRTLETAEKDLGLPPQISRFVLTVGSTANQNGTALFEGITVLFLAQVYNIDLSLSSQIQVVLMSVLAGIGTAGVPGGSLPLIMILLISVGIPPEGLGIILGVDRFLDMCRTTINVSGDLVIAALVSENAAPVPAVIGVDSEPTEKTLSL